MPTPDQRKFTIQAVKKPEKVVSGMVSGKPKSLGSGGSMVASLKLKGIDLL